MAAPGVLLRNAAANFSQRGVAWLVVLVLPPLLVRHMDKSSYATWMLLLQVGAYISLLDTSLQSSTIYFVARGKGLQNEEYVGDMLSSAGAILIGTSAVAAIFTLIASWKLSALFHNIPGPIVSNASMALLLVGLSLSIAQPFSVIAGYFKGLQRGEIAAVTTAAGKVAGACGVGWAAYHHHGLVAMAASTAAGNLVAPVMYLFAWARWGQKDLLKLSRIRLEAVRSFLGYWLGRMATQFCGAVITGLDLPIVAAFDFPSAGYYAIAATLANMLSVPQASIGNALLPATSSLGAYATPERLGATLIKVTRYGVSILLLLCFPLVFGMSLFLRMWVGQNYAMHAFPFGIVLACAVFVRETMSSFVLISVSAGQQQRTLISPVVEAAVNLVCSLVLVHWLGALGVAAGDTDRSVCWSCYARHREHAARECGTRGQENVVRERHHPSIPLRTTGNRYAHDRHVDGSGYETAPRRSHPRGTHRGAQLVLRQLQRR